MTPAIHWNVPATFPSLEREELHVWCAWLDEPELSASPGGLLSVDELARARAFHFEPDRRRFIAARAVLRHLLGAYLETPASRLQFTYGTYGKPLLKPAWLQFNVSHSGPLGLFVISRHKDVGIDLEENRDLPDLDLIETRVFTAAEAEHLRALGPEARRREFYRRWTRREAAGKCTGIGLDLDGNGPTRALDVPPPQPPQHEAVDPAENFLGTVAYEGPPATIHRFRFATQILPAHARAPHPAPRPAWHLKPGSVFG